jgi:hypothetical protein
MSNALGFSPPCCCLTGCVFCGDGLTPDYLTLTGSGYIDRTLNGTTSYPGRMISPLSVLNRAHQLDRVFVGELIDYPVGFPLDACAVVYRSAEYEFGDLFIGDITAAEGDYENEDYWRRDLVYALLIGLKLDAGYPTKFIGFADSSGGSQFIGGSVLAGEYDFTPGAILGDVGATTLGQLNRTTLCSTPSSATIQSPEKFTSIRVYNPASPSTWWRADTSSGGSTYVTHYSYTDGDQAAGSDPNEQTTAALSLIASAGRS